MKKYYLRFLLILPLMISSCSNIITGDDDGKTMEFALNSEFRVQLEGSGEPGYEWRVVGKNHKVFEQIGEPEIKLADESGSTIATYTFTFKTISAGNAILRMIYYDKNAEDPKPEKEFELRIISGTIGRIES